MNVSCRYWAHHSYMLQSASCVNCFRSVSLWSNFVRILSGATRTPAYLNVIDGRHIGSITSTTAKHMLKSVFSSDIDVQVFMSHSCYVIRHEYSLAVSIGYFYSIIQQKFRTWSSLMASWIPICSVISPHSSFLKSWCNCYHCYRSSVITWRCSG